MAGKTVLVVDADAETEQIIESALESEGYLVFSVRGGDVGAEMAQKVKPSLIFVCPKNSGGEGVEVCRKIRSYESMKSVPIILLTSGGERVDPGSCGAVDSLRLPVSAAELLEKTKKAVAAKAPIVLSVMEKVLEVHKAKGMVGGTPPPEGSEVVGLRSRPSDLSEIAGMEETEEVPPVSPRRWGDHVETDVQGEGDGSGRKSNKMLVVLVAILVIVAGAAGALYFGGVLPGLSRVAKMQTHPLQMAEKPKTPEPSPAGDLNKQQEGVEQARRAPAAVAPAVSAPQSSSTSPMAAKPSGKKVYSVQVGAFRSEENAGMLVKQMRVKGYDVFLVEGSSKDKGTIYRVLVGRFDNSRESRKLAAAIREKEKIKTVTVAE